MYSVSLGEVVTCEHWNLALTTGNSAAVNTSSNNYIIILSTLVQQSKLILSFSKGEELPNICEIGEIKINNCSTGT